MFGIGLPEMIVILAVALIVVGPDKLPDLARSLAKGVVELKKTMNQLKQSLTEDEAISTTTKDLRETGKELQGQLASKSFQPWTPEDKQQAGKDAAGSAPTSSADMTDKIVAQKEPILENQPEPAEHEKKSHSPDPAA